MAQPAKFIISEFTNPSGDVVFRVTGWLDGKRVRKKYATKAETTAARQLLKIQNLRSDTGAPRVMEELRGQGVRTSKRRCARLLKTLGLFGRCRCRRKQRTTDSRHGQAPAPNLLAQRSAPTGPDQVWATDIT